jgi:hypothetical protein
MGGGVLGQDQLGNFILGTISTGEAVPHEGSISATLSIPTISAALTVGTISAAITINTISAVVTINEESG